MWPIPRRVSTDSPGPRPVRGTVPSVIGFSIWNALWVIVVTFTLIVVLMAMFAVVIDLSRDPDLPGIVKVVWMLALVLLPIVGLLIYVIVRGRGMSARSHAT